MTFNDTLEELRAISKQLRDKGVTVEKLDEAIAELTKHHSNIEKIETNIDAIKSEVIAPLKEELRQNKTAGKFSIFGFWVGAFGLVVSIGTLLFQQDSPINLTIPSNSSNTEIIKRLHLIETQLLFPKTLSAKEGEVFIERSEITEIASDGDDKFYLLVDSTNDWPKGEGIKGGIKIFKENVLLGKQVLKGNILRSDGVPELRPWFDNEVIAVDVGDKITIGNVELAVVSILSRDVKGRLRGDERDGIVFNRSVKRNITKQSN